MSRRVSFVFILIAVGGCVSPDARSSQLAQSSATELARQRELARQAAIQSNIHQHEQSRTLIFTTLSGHEQRIQSLRSDSLTASNQLATLNSEVEAYLWDHKITVACMGMTGAALSDDNEYSDDVKAAVTGGAILCGLGLLSAAFRSEVADVIDTLIQADAQAKNLQSQVRTLSDQIAQETFGSTLAQARIDSITSEIGQLQLQLQQVPSN